MGMFSHDEEYNLCHYDEMKLRNQLRRMTELVDKVISAMKDAGESKEAIEFLRRKRDEILK